MEYKTSNQPTNQVGQGKARQDKTRQSMAWQERKLANKHFYFMAFDNIGGTYLFPCHASSNQMRTI